MYDMYSQLHYDGHPRAATVVKIILQVVVYSLWKERNLRIVASSSTSEAAAFSMVDLPMPDGLLSLPSVFLLSVVFLFHFPFQLVLFSFVVVISWAFQHKLCKTENWYKFLTFAPLKSISSYLIWLYFIYFFKLENCDHPSILAKDI